MTNRICPSCFAPIFLATSTKCSTCGQEYPFMTEEIEKWRDDSFEASDREMIKVMTDAVDKYLKQKQDKLDNLYMDIAIRVSEMSHAQRRKVGAVLVKDNNILGFGWNGMPTGFNNQCEIDDVSDPKVIHAEENVFAKLARSTGNGTDSTLYLTLSPCYGCSKMIIQVGVKRVVYLEEYRISDAIGFLREAGIQVDKLTKGQPQSQQECQK